ncbi:MAG: nucleotidyltransferase family protein [Campylobacterales bacterium]|nr:nucleotidyltransferase family protein [Campylobacterales bacterium]
MTKDEILNYLRVHKSDFKDRFGVIKIGLFGSFARDEQREDSDIDLVIELEKDKKNLKTFFDIKRELEEYFGKNVDLGIEQTLKPIVKEHVKKDIIYV